jgi:hypothetical protein
MAFYLFCAQSPLRATQPGPGTGPSGRRVPPPISKAPEQRDLNRFIDGFQIMMGDPHDGIAETCLRVSAPA